MWGNVVSQTGVKILGKQGLAIKAQEPAYNETYGRISIYNFQKDEKILNHKPVNQIYLDGVIYPTAQAFIVAFNALLTACCCGSGSGDSTAIIEAFLSKNCCPDCNDWSIGTVESATKTFDALSLHSITIIVVSGTVNVSNGTENADLVDGESVTWTGSQLLTQQVIIDASSGKANYAIITCKETVTTTTEEPVITTTTEEETTTTTTQQR